MKLNIHRILTLSPALEYHLKKAEKIRREISNINICTVNKLEIKSPICVNSKHKARFLANDTEDYCQCSFGECKVKVSITFNGHAPYDYVLTEKEIEEAEKVVFSIHK